MAFPQKLLGPNEEVVLESNPNWSILMPRSVVFVAVVAGCIALLVVLPHKTPVFVGWLLLAACGVALIWLLLKVTSWRSTSLVITNQRVVYRAGVLRRLGREIPLDRVQDVTYEQSLFERMLGAGTLTVESAGASGEEPFPDIRHPAVVQSLINRLLTQGPGYGGGGGGLGGRGGGYSGPSGPSGPQYGPQQSGPPQPQYQPQPQPPYPPQPQPPYQPQPQPPYQPQPQPPYQPEPQYQPGQYAPQPQPQQYGPQPQQYGQPQAGQYQPQQPQQPPQYGPSGQAQGGQYQPQQQYGQPQAPQQPAAYPQSQQFRPAAQPQYQPVTPPSHEQTQPEAPVQLSPAEGFRSSASQLSGSQTEQLQHLEHLRNAGVITEAEYRLKRQEAIEGR